MAEVFIAAAPDADAQAGGLAQALKTLGFDATAGAPAEAEIAKLVDEAKCVIGLWSRGAPTAEQLRYLTKDNHGMNLGSVTLGLQNPFQRMSTEVSFCWTYDPAIKFTSA